MYYPLQLDKYILKKIEKIFLVRLGLGKAAFLGGY